MLSSCDAENGKQDERCDGKHSPQFDYLRFACFPELFRQQHDNHQKPCVTAKKQIAAVQSVAEHGALVDKDVFD